MTARAEMTNGFYKSECVYGLDPTGWDDVDELELATLYWVRWLNEDRLHGHGGDIPLAEYEAEFYAAEDSSSVQVNEAPTALPRILRRSVSTRRRCCLNSAVMEMRSWSHECWRAHMTLYEPSPSETLASFLDGIAEAYSARLALSSADDGDMTYADLRMRSAVVAGRLLGHGVGKGTRVGLLYGNDLGWVVHWAALTRIGAVCVPLSTLSTPQELARLVAHADVQGLIVQETCRGRDLVSVVADALLVDGTIGECFPFLSWVCVDTDVAPVWAESGLWLAADGVDRSALVAAASAAVHRDDEAICIYTSGQSADPKGVCHTHASVVTKAMYLRDMLGLVEGAQIPATLPFFWVGGLVMALFTGLAAGATVRCGERDPIYDGIQIGSTAVVENPFANLRAMPALGMTETFGMYSFGHEWRAEGYPVCVPLDELQPGFDLRLVDDRGADADEGEILLRGPSVAARIYKVDRASTFDSDGFLRTGDLGRREGSRVHFLGRRSDVIKVSGANVSPAEVERELMAFDEVEVAHVTGVPVGDGNVVVGAAVVLHAGASATAGALRDRVAVVLSSYKVPRALALVTADEVPMTPSLKVRMPALAALIAERSSL